MAAITLVLLGLIAGITALPSDSVVSKRGLVIVNEVAEADAPIFEPESVFYTPEKLEWTEDERSICQSVCVRACSSACTSATTWLLSRRCRNACERSCARVCSSDE